MRWTTYVMVVLASVPAAGCSDAPSATSLQAAPSGTLVVRVVDTEQRPLEGARVWVDGMPADTTSDAAGLVVVSSLSPGDYEVRVNRTGYWDNTTTVEVIHNQTTERWVEMEEVPGPRDVLNQEWARPYCGLVLPPLPGEEEPRCRSPPLATGPEATLPFEPGLRTVVLRMHWEASSEASARLTFNVSLREAAFANQSDFFTVEGSSPIRIVLEAPVVPDELARSGGNVSVVVRTPEADPTRPFVDQPVDVGAVFHYRIWPDLTNGPDGS